MHGNQVIKWQSDHVTEWPIDRVTEWPNDQVTDDRVTEWPSDRVTEWLKSDRDINSNRPGRVGGRPISDFWRTSGEKVLEHPPPLFGRHNMWTTPIYQYMILSIWNIGCTYRNTPILYVYIYIFFFFRPSGWASWWRVFYHLGLPCLV